ncbi:MAG TPA: NAD(P)H-dependent oxidoreductase subunit E [Bryobacteraceae bacterium]|jgi:bidirectional [NiFe] hydrogenase diaphorase subunit|nr:NAD(P)H-dependent oxidoreductase subunit E [Bryobacteraceae bacterium]
MLAKVRSFTQYARLDGPGTTMTRQGTALSHAANQRHTLKVVRGRAPQWLRANPFELGDRGAQSPFEDMFAYLQKCEPPTDDKRWKMVAATMRKLGNERHALIEALHTLQQSFGYLDKPGLTYIAASLKIPLSQVYGAATFYNHFTMKPQGEHACVVCTGTACYIRGSGELLKSIFGAQAVKPGETTPDGRLSVLTARCFGACGLAPVVVLDGDVIGRITPEILEGRLKKVMDHAG